MKAKILFASVALALGFIGRAQSVSDFVSIPNPDDLEVDRFGNIWVNYRVSMSSNEYRLARISPTGTVTDIIVENHTLGQFGVNDSIILIAGDWGINSYVYKYDHFGNRLDSISMPYPTEILLEPDGTWYIAQNAIGTLTKVYPNNTTETLASGFPLNHSLALARDENGMFYTCNLMNAKVIKIDPNTGTKTTLLTLPVVSPYSVGFLSYHQGNLYVPSFKHCIYKVDTAGVTHSVFAGAVATPGDVNGPISTSLMNTPIATYPSITGDTLYFTDSGNGKLKMIIGMNSTLQVDKAQQTETTLELYPNPAEETLCITLGTMNENIDQIDLIGPNGIPTKNLPLSWSDKLKCYTLTLEGIPIGNYLLKITTSTGEVRSKKFVKL